MMSQVINEIEYNLGPLSEKQIHDLQFVIASYGLACLMDSSVGREAETISLEYESEKEETDSLFLKEKVL